VTFSPSAALRWTEVLPLEGWSGLPPTQDPPKRLLQLAQSHPPHHHLTTSTIWQGLQPVAVECDPPVPPLGSTCCTDPAQLLSVGWKPCLASHRATCTYAWALHGLAASVQQPPAERLPLPELAERGNAKSGQLHCWWGSQGSSGHQGQGG
jgi:hypothetical protein